MFLTTFYLVKIIHSTVEILYKDTSNDIIFIRPNRFDVFSSNAALFHRLRNNKSKYKIFHEDGFYSTEYVGQQNIFDFFFADVTSNGKNVECPGCIHFVSAGLFLDNRRFFCDFVDKDEFKKVLIYLKDEIFPDPSEKFSKCSYGIVSADRYNIELVGNNLSGKKSLKYGVLFTKEMLRFIVFGQNFFNDEDLKAEEADRGSSDESFYSTFETPAAIAAAFTSLSFETSLFLTLPAEMENEAFLFLMKHQSSQVFQLKYGDETKVEVKKKEFNLWDILKGKVNKK